MHTERLRHLIEVLKRPEVQAHFDLGSWADHNPLAQPTDDTLCGTTACACGWAALDPQMQAWGLQLQAIIWPTHSNDAVYQVIKLATDLHVLGHNPEISGFETQICFDRWFGFEAAAAFFSIAYEDAERLFDPSKYEGRTTHPNAVIARIERLLAEAEPA